MVTRIWLSKIFHLKKNYPVIYNFIQNFCTYENDPGLWPSSDPCLGDYHLDSNVIVGRDADIDAELYLEIDWDKSVAK